MKEISGSTFKYHSIYSMGEYVYSWEAQWNGTKFSGTSGSVSGAYKAARQEIKRACKMGKWMKRQLDKCS